MNTFYVNDVKTGNRVLSTEEAKHCLLVMRLKSGDEIRVVDGIGGVYRSKLIQVDKKMCSFEVLEQLQIPKKPFRIHLGIAPTKNADRMEWMIEKLAEMGVDEVTFIRTDHSERSKLRVDRLEKKAISAMKQSGNAQLMVINDMTSLDLLLKVSTKFSRYMAHVDASHPYLAANASPADSILILIGPEGDFSESELKSAIDQGVIPVGLGQNTLRTETAGMVACQIINTLNSY